jgi:hypothetical protein
MIKIGKTTRIFVSLFLIAFSSQNIFALVYKKPLPLKKEVRKAIQIEPRFQTTYEAFTGQQAQNWPTDAKPAIHPGAVIPVFIGGFPDRQYVILGYVFVSYPKEPFSGQQEEAIKVAALDAKKHGATAFLLRSPKKFSKTCYAVGTAIRWMTKQDEWKVKAEVLRDKALAEVHP